MKIIQIAWGRILPSDRISTAKPGPLRYVLLAATMLGLHGCMSSPADQLAQIQTTAATRPANLVELAAQQSAAASEEQSEIANQAHQDVQSLDPADLGVTDDASANQNQGLLTQPKNIAATQNSIYSTTDSNFTQQGLVPKTGRLKVEPVAATKSSIYANNSVEAVIAADSRTEQSAADTLPSYDSLAERMAVPMPDAKDVKQVQDVAMADTEIPVLDPNPTLNALDTATGPDSELAAADPAIADLDALQANLARPVAAETEEQPEKKPLTLADLFRKKDSKDFDGDRFAKKKTLTRGIPNMQTAALSDNALPGVNVNAMFPTNRMPDDEEHEGDDEDAPAGLMQLASLPSMTRLAPNGLYIQTDKVEVRCLRSQLVDLIHQVENHYKRPAIITSGFRDRRHNRRAGGVRHSLHTLCAAADIQVQGVSKWELADYLRSLPGRGGIGTYCHTESVHIDIGSERDWNWRCRRKKRARS
ncbi:YcbK family protein [Rhizobium sp. LjRoot254]|uniref:YcbK family protein n=1 Tax=Rhizobium sp. LjRoot254 TaxID=3342297 RepID=UPI003ECE5767